MRRPRLGTLRSVWESVRESYWFVPSLMAALAATLALAMLEVDRRLAAQWVRELPWIRETGAEGTRAVLATIAGSMITVTGVVFSITIVALTLATSQFGPRVLRTFLRDRHNQLVLGTFVATFLYVLLVLRMVREGHVPQLATAVAALLAVISVFVLIYFIHHAASSIQVSSVIAAVSAEIERQLPVLFPESPAEDEERPMSAEESAHVDTLASDGIDVEARGSGYVRVIDVGALVALAAQHDLLVRLFPRPGDFVQPGLVLARVGPAQRAGEDVCAAIRESWVLGDARTPIQDLGFLTGQLAEIAVRALSPGVNDPGTAVACARRLGHVVGRLAGRPMPTGRVRDREGRLRVLASPTRFASLVAGCLDPVRRYGARDADVAVALLQGVGWAMRQARDAERRALLLDHAFEIHDAFAAESHPAKRDVCAVQAALAEATSNAPARLDGCGARHADRALG